jgi:DNA-3-methyladenine glycosylase II
VLALDQRPTQKQLAALVQRWMPHRSVAARLLWAYYGLQKSAFSTGAATSRLPI